MQSSAVPALLKSYPLGHHLVVHVSTAPHLQLHSLHRTKVYKYINKYKCYIGIYMYTYDYRCIYSYMIVYNQSCIGTYTCVSVSIYFTLCVYICICVCVCVYAMYISMYTCEDVDVYVHLNRLICIYELQIQHSNSPPSHTKPSLLH